MFHICLIYMGLYVMIYDSIYDLPLQCLVKGMVGVTMQRTANGKHSVVENDKAYNLAGFRAQNDALLVFPGYL